MTRAPLLTWLTVATLVGAVSGCSRAESAPRPEPAPAASEPTTAPACAGHVDGSLFCEGHELRVCEHGRPTVRQTCWDIERCDASAAACFPDCPQGEVYIPATGTDGFVMGRGKQQGRDTPHRVVLTRPFCIDETEVTVAAYTRCLEAKACEEPKKWDQYASYPRFPDQPVNMVSWDKAKTYCAWAGKQLPTEAQWEWAATGDDGREWPWGNEPPTCKNGLADFTPGGAPKWAPGGDVGCRGGGPSPAMAHPKGAKQWPSGKIYDLGGNVWEWTRDFAVPYTPAEAVDPEVPAVAGRLDYTVVAIRGGGWNRSAMGCTTWFRAEAVTSYQVPGLGFRCSRTAQNR